MVVDKGFSRAETEVIGGGQRVIVYCSECKESFIYPAGTWLEWHTDRHKSPIAYVAALDAATPYLVAKEALNQRMRDKNA